MTILRLSAYLLLPGLAWGWVLPDSGQRLRVGAGVVCLAGILVLSLVVSLLSVTALAWFGLYREPIGWAVQLGFCTAGFALGAIFARGRLRAHVLRASPGAIAWVIVSLLLLIMPNRGEWLVGGWDSGVYVNEGVYVEHTGSLHPAPDPAHAVLHEPELSAFTRVRQGFSEIFPGFPIDSRDRAIRFTFYPLTPVLTAIMHRCGGLRLSLHVGAVVSVGILVCLASVLLLQGMRLGSALVCTAFLAANPLFLYHGHTPGSELVQLFLYLGMLLFLTHGRATPWSPVVVCALILCCLLNRISFVLFGAILLVALGVADFPRSERRKVWLEHTGFVLCFAAGVAFYRILHPLATIKIRQVLDRMEIAAWFMLIGLILMDTVGSFPVLRRRLSTLLSRQRVNVLSLAAAAVFLGTSAVNSYFRSQLITNSLMLAQYNGWLVVCLALGGMVVWLRRPVGTPRFDAVVWTLVLAVAVTLRHKHAAELYPYATKRFLLSVPVLVACGAGFAVSRLWSMPGRRPLWRVAAVALALAAVLANGVRSLDAWARTEYDGVADALADVAHETDRRTVILADHFLWGTPLAVSFGESVLNGEPLWAAESGERTAAALDALAILREQGFTVLMLTSTEKGPDLFPLRFRTVSPVKDFGAFSCSEMAHHKRSRSFTLRDRRVWFRLFEWQPEEIESL